MSALMNFLNTQITLIKSVDLLTVKILLLLHWGNPFRIIKYLETIFHFSGKIVSLIGIKREKVGFGIKF